MALYPSRVRSSDLLGMPVLATNIDAHATTPESTAHEMIKPISAKGQLGRVWIAASRMADVAIVATRTASQRIPGTMRRVATSALPAPNAVATNAMHENRAVKLSPVRAPSQT